MSFFNNIKNFGNTNVISGNSSLGSAIGGSVNINDISSALQGVQSGGLNTGDLVATGLDVGLGAATGGIYTLASTALSAVFGVSINEGVSNMTNYGANSWGASTTPEGIGQHISEFQKYIEKQLSIIENGQIQKGMNELGRFLWWGQSFYGRMRQNHAKANSTKEAYDMAIDFFQKGIHEIWKPLEKSLWKWSKSKEVSISGNDFLHLGQPVNQNDPPFKYWELTINVDKMAKDLGTIETPKTKEELIDEAKQTTSNNSNTTTTTTKSKEQSNFLRNFIISVVLSKVLKIW